MSHKRKQGRPRHEPPLKAKRFYVTEEQSQLLRMWGRGDMSAGLRWLIEAAAPMIRQPPKEAT